MPSHVCRFRVELPLPRSERKRAEDEGLHVVASQLLAEHGGELCEQLGEGFGYVDFGSSVMLPKLADEPDLVRQVSVRLSVSVFCPFLEATSLAPPNVPERLTL